MEITDITLGEVYRAIVAQASDVAEIKSDVKQQTGTVADLKTRVTVLEDRGTQAKDNQARYAGWFGVAGTVGTWVYQLYTHKP
jgi:hypothetical protein